MYYLFISKGISTTAYIGKKSNNVIAECSIKLVKEFGSYRVCYTNTLVNLNIVQAYELGNGEIVDKFINKVQSITNLELTLLAQISQYIEHNEPIKTKYDIRKSKRSIIYRPIENRYDVSVIDFKNDQFINFYYLNREYKISKAVYAFDNINNSYVINGVDNSFFDSIPNNFLKERQFLVEFMQHLVLLIADKSII